LHDAFGHELAQNVALRRTHRSAHADFPSPQVTLTSITFMMTIPPMTTEIALTRMKTPKNAELMLRHGHVAFFRAE